MSNYGDEGFLSPLNILLECANNEAQLNTFGRFMLREMFLTALSNRLYIQEAFRSNQDAIKRPVQQPIFIVGHPRTGTTLLHNLFSQDPDNRVLRMYETLAPASLTVGTANREQALKNAARFIKATYYIAPQIPVIHPLDASGPDECLKLIENTFTSPHFLLYFQADKYWRWLLDKDTEYFLEIYEYHKQQLQLLQGNDHSYRWILKAPVHLFFLDALLKVYPDAFIIHTHRSPEDAVPSFCSLAAVSRGIASDVVDTSEIGRLSLDLFAEANRRAEKAKQTLDSKQLYDLDYSDLIKNPIETIRSIYNHFDLEMSKDTEDKMQLWLIQNPQNKHGKHRYTLEEFGLTKSDVISLSR